MKKHRIKTNIIALSVSILVLLFSVGCDKDNPTESGSPKITNVNGNWSGKTSQDYDVTFTITTDKVTSFKIKIRTPSFTQETQVAGEVCSLIDFSFSFSSYSSSATLYITCDFNSNTSAEGTFRLGSTEGTWTASR